MIPLYLYNRDGESILSYTKITEAPTATFYVIDPEIKPLPYGSELFCVEQDSTGIVKNVSEMYDPFNRDRKCLRFLAWNDPAPYTVQVFLYIRPTGVFITTEPTQGERELVFSPIHLCTKDLPFSNYNGRCLPDPEGTSIEKCLKKNSIGKQPLFLSNIPQRFSREEIVILIAFIVPFLILLAKRIKLKST